MNDDHYREQAAFVEAFITNNPDFFLHRDDLLAEIRIPHHSGKAVSLVEKQLSVLRERNTELRHRLGALVETARDNDRLFNHTRRLVLALLDCQTLQQAIDVIYNSFSQDFGIQKTQIILFEGQSISHARRVSLADAQQSIGKYLKARQTIGGGLSRSEMQFLFGRDVYDVGSAALAILAYGKLYGVLAIGNRDPFYYQSSMGTMFLGYIAEVFSRILRDLQPGV